MAEEQLVIFRLGKEEYGVSISQVREIIQYKGTTRIPNTAEYMEGIINLRGKVIPVIELATRFGVVTNEGSEKRAIIIETAKQEIGVIVDEVTGVIWLQDVAIESTPAMTASNDYIRGIGKDNDRLLILLNLERLFSTEEVSKIKTVE